MSNVTFRVAMSEPHRHLFEVAVTVKNPQESTLFRMPVWTPGSYLVREFSKHVQDVTAVGDSGQACPVEKRDKASWEVHSEGASTITLNYRVYAYDLTVRTSHLDGTHGYFNGANVFACPEGYEQEPLQLEVVPPEGWMVSVALPRVSSEEEGPQTFWAVDFDELVDSPVECGPHEEVLFEAGGVTHRWVSWGDPDFKVDDLLGDVTAVIEEEISLFGNLPEDVDDYLFIAHVQDRRNGGLEHKKSQTIGIDRRSLTHAKCYEDFITLVAHEYFHVWNVKRIRPQGLGPFDYSGENYTPLLWMMEGFTGYYDTLIPVRAGLMTVPRYFEIIGERIAALKQTPGRHVRSLESSSFDAWIKLYRPDENTINTAVSYYLKGELAAWLMDLSIRRQTQGERSLDDVMRLLWDRQQKTGEGIDPAGVDALFREATGVTLDEEIQAWTREVSDLPFEDELKEIGLTLTGSWKKTHDRSRIDGGKDKEPAPWLGIITQQAAGLTKISKVRSDGPAAETAIYAGDELIAINDLRVSHSNWDNALALHAVGDVVTLTLSRRKRLVTTEVTLAERPCDQYALEMSENATDAQRSLISGWLGQPWPSE